MNMPDPSQLRISDQDRHQVAEVLREAAGEGRIDMEELDERLDATYAARTYADLVPITLDLPATRPDGQPAARPAMANPTPVVAGPVEERHVAILGGFERKGVWVVPQQLHVVAFMGGADLDLRQAQFAASEVTITVNAIMGGADIKVSPQTHVIMEGTGIMGGYSGPNDEFPADLSAQGPRLRVKGFAIMGGVNVSRKPLPGTHQPGLRRRH